MQDIAIKKEKFIIKYLWKQKLSFKWCLEMYCIFLCDVFLSLTLSLFLMCLLTFFRTIYFFLKFGLNRSYLLSIANVSLYYGAFYFTQYQITLWSWPLSTLLRGRKCGKCLSWIQKNKIVKIVKYLTQL